MALPVFSYPTSEMGIDLRGEDAQMAVYPETDEPEKGLLVGGARGICLGGQVAYRVCASVSLLSKGHDATCSQGYRAVYTLQVEALQPPDREDSCQEERGSLWALERDKLVLGPKS